MADALVDEIVGALGRANDEIAAGRQE